MFIFVFGSPPKSNICDVSVIKFMSKLHYLYTDNFLILNFVLNFRIHRGNLSRHAVTPFKIEKAFGILFHEITYVTLPLKLPLPRPLPSPFLRLSLSPLFFDPVCVQYNDGERDLRGFRGRMMFSRNIQSGSKTSCVIISCTLM